MYCSNKVCALCIVITVILSTAVSSQQFQQPQPYQYAFNDGRRRFNSGGLGGASSLTSSPAASSDFIKFPDDDQRNIPVTSLFHGKDDNNDYGRDNNDDETKSNLDLDDKQESSNEISHVPVNITEGVCTYDDFYRLLDDDSRSQLEMISPRFGGENIERSQGVRPMPANCIPEMTVVPLKLIDGSDSKDPTIVVFPSCTRVKRCGGCCNNNLVECQPIETKTILFEVIKSQYQGGNRMVFKNKELVPVEEHVRCKCDCKMKEHHCSTFQRYNKSQCMCVCINIEDKNKCAKQTNKVWEPESCTCRCRDDEIECSTGSYYDQNLCKCIETPGHRHTQVITDRKRLIKKPVIYVPETPETFYDSGT